ncbi:MAG: HAD family hydrolase [Terriglobales bacterium]
MISSKPRVAAFDCDGTLWSGDSGQDFFYWEMERGLLPEAVSGWARPRYEDYRDGRVVETTMCGEMVTLHAGLEAIAVARAAEEFFADRVEPRIFPEMQELVRQLAASGCEIWAVSSTCEWVVRAGARRFGIPPDRVLAARAEVEDGRVTNRLLSVPTGEAKATALRQSLAGELDAAFGNTMNDLAMLELARHAFAVNPRPQLQSIALGRNWGVYFPAPIQV